MSRDVERHTLTLGLGEIKTCMQDSFLIEALKILLHDQEPDRDFIEQTMQKDSSTLALLYFHLHFYFIRNSGEWIHDGSR